MDIKGLGMRRVKRLDDEVVSHGGCLTAALDIMKHMTEVFSKPSDESERADSLVLCSGLDELIPVMNDMRSSFVSMNKSLDKIKAFLKEHENDKCYGTFVNAIAACLGYPLSHQTISDIIAIENDTSTSKKSKQ